MGSPVLNDRVDRPIACLIVGVLAIGSPLFLQSVELLLRHAKIVEAYLNAGVQYVILGTKAVNEPHFVSDLCVEFPRHIIVGLDATDQERIDQARFCMVHT